VDLALFKALNGFAAGHDGFEDPIRLFSEWSPYFFAALLVGIFLARGSYATRTGRRGVVAAGFSALFALGAAQVIGELWNRPRPYEAHADVAHLFVAASPDPSFPSDHATAAFAIAVAILLRSRRPGLVALVMAIVLAISRVVVGTHYPSDVLGGAVLGTLAALILWHPSVRGLVHRLADWAASVYERLAVWAIDRRFGTAST
jgi:undecaprenyl-diphosphatase